jgi:DME family drug/metabolite transporter
MAVYQTAYFAAVGTAGVAIATVVTLGCGPVLVALGSSLWMAERLDRRAALIVVLALVGLVVLVLGGSSGGTATNPPLGIALALLSAAGYAGTTLLSRTLGTRADRGAGSAPHPLGDALLGFAIGSVCLLPLSLATGILPSGAGLGLTTAILAYLGLVPSALAYV